MRRFGLLLKCIGIVLFIGILLHVDLTNVAAYYLQADVSLLVLGLAVLLGALGAKALRWHILATAAGARHGKEDSWREFMIGVFLSTFTPAKLGDFGKVAYLKKEGVGTKTGALLVVMERVADIVILLPFAALSAVILAQKQGLIIGSLVTAGMLLCTALVAQYWSKFRAAILYCIRHHALLNVLLTTFAGWMLHYLWVICLAQALEITVSIPILIAAMTTATMLNALPISPSGLGTREAALLAVLLPYGVDAERIVALSTMMLLQLIILAVIGGWYWIRDVKHSIHVPSTL